MSAARFSLRDHPMVVAAISVIGFALGTWLAVVVFPGSQWGRDIAGLATAFVAGFSYWIYRKRPGATTAAETNAQAPVAWRVHPYLAGVAGFAIVALAILLIVTFVPRGVWSFVLMTGVIVTTMAMFQFLYRRRAAPGGQA